MNWISLIVLLVIVLTGCATNGKSDSALPIEGQSRMIDIYRNATHDAENEKPRTQEQITELCKKLNSTYAQKDCVEKAKKKGLVSEQLTKDSSKSLGQKKQPARPKPLYADYSRTAINEMRVLFARLPNPDIAIYVYPHLASKNRVPVPGYMTVIPLHERVEYAMPGE